VVVRGLRPADHNRVLAPHAVPIQELQL